MKDTFVLSNVRPNGGDPKDVFVRDGIITDIAERGTKAGTDGMEVVDGAGLLMLPGLVDAHTHLDKTLLGMPWYRNCVGTELIELIENERRMKTVLGIEPKRQSAAQIRQSVINGTAHIRTHVDVDTEHRLAGLHGVLASRETYREVVDIEIVAFPQSGMLVRPGTVDLMEQALREGADVVGGLDPSEVDRDPKGHLDTIFGMAERHGKPVDIHLHESDALGVFAIELIAERTRALGMSGKVTISHGFCLGMVSDRQVARLGDMLARAGVHLMTKGGAASAAPPVQDLAELGVNVCSGSDGVRDTWSPFGNADMLDRAAVVSQRNDFRSDRQIELALHLCTFGGARMMNIDSYGLDVGNNATFVLVPAETPADAVASRPAQRSVYRKGVMVAKNGELLPH
jgi:cytosine/adenosine deaminase-related metal-dependent hydrolase